MVNNKYPFCSIIMPVRDEERAIERTLKSILEQDYPQDKLEIIIVDGMSKDATRAIIKKVISKNSMQDKQMRFELLDNPAGIVPSALNIGLRQAKGKIIIRIDGHCEIGFDYVSKCVEKFYQTEADCVGGLQKAVAECLKGKAISLATTSLFGAGNAAFRHAKKSGWTDTVYLGAYRREVFERIGGFDEELMRNQDDEFNFRLIQSGGKIWLDPAIRSVYYGRTSLNSLWRQYFQYGLYKVRVMQKRKAIFSLRHIVPALFILSILSGLLLTVAIKQVFWILLVCLPYVCVNILFSLWIAKNNLPTIFFLPLSFLTIHLSYGIGFILGLWQWRKKWKETNGKKEKQRLRGVYTSYQQNKSIQNKWAADNKGNKFMASKRSELLMNILQSKSGFSLKKIKVLDVGCGHGDVLKDFLWQGVRSENLYGVDLFIDRIEEAKKRHPKLRLQCANAEKLYFSDNFFDLVLFFTVFSSILDKAMAKNLASEAMRVLKPGGLIALYDVRYPNPFNPNTRSVTKKSIRGLFEGNSEISFYSLTLIPQIARLLAHLSFKMCCVLEKIPFLRSHYLVIIRKI